MRALGRVSVAGVLLCLAVAAPAAADGPGVGAPAVVTLNPGEVPSDEQLEAEAQALETEAQDKYDLAKRDDLDLTALQHMSNDELFKLAKKEN